MPSSVFVVHREPSPELPIVQGRFDAPTADLDGMRELVAACTATSDWSLLRMPSDLGKDPRSTVLRSADGVVESYFVSENQIS